MKHRRDELSVQFQKSLANLVITMIELSGGIEQWKKTMKLRMSI